MRLLGVVVLGVAVGALAVLAWGAWLLWADGGCCRGNGGTK